MAQKGAIILLGYNPFADICLWGYGGYYIGEPTPDHIFEEIPPAMIFEEVDPGRVFTRVRPAIIFNEVKPCEN